MSLSDEGPEVIDSDGHVIEPDSVWSDYADPGFREMLAGSRGGQMQRLAMSQRVSRC